MRFSVLIFSILLFSCGETGTNEKSDSKKSESKDSATATQKINLDEKVVYLIEELEEVQKLMKEIDYNSKGKSRLCIWVSDGPEITKMKYYWVKVGEDNGENVATLLNFYVDPVSEKILFYNVIEDTLLELEDTPLSAKASHLP